MNRSRSLKVIILEWLSCWQEQRLSKKLIELDRIFRLLPLFTEKIQQKGCLYNFGHVSGLEGHPWVTLISFYSLMLLEIAEQRRSQRALRFSARLASMCKPSRTCLLASLQYIIGAGFFVQVLLAANRTFGLISGLNYCGCTNLESNWGGCNSGGTWQISKKKTKQYDGFDSSWCHAVRSCHLLVFIVVFKPLNKKLKISLLLGRLFKHNSLRSVGPFCLRNL